MNQTGSSSSFVLGENSSCRLMLAEMSRMCWKEPLTFYLLDCAEHTVQLNQDIIKGEQ